MPWTVSRIGSLGVLGVLLLIGLDGCVGDEPTVLQAPAPPSTTGAGGPDASADGTANGDPAAMDGRHRFVKSWPGFDEASGATAIGGDVLIAGRGTGRVSIENVLVDANRGSDDFIVVRAGEDGVPRWRATFGGNGHDRPQATSARGANLYVSGWTESSDLALAGVELPRPYSTRGGLLVRLDAGSGAPLWGRVMQSEAPARFDCGGVAATTAGVAHACTFDLGAKLVSGVGDPDFDITALVNPGGAGDVAIVFYDPDGTRVWMNAIKGTGAERLGAIAADPTTGDVLVLVNAASATVFDSKPSGLQLTKPVTTPATVPVPLLVRLAKDDGRVVWSKFLGEGAVGVEAHALAVSPDGQTIAVGGTFRSSTDFGGGPRLTPSGTGDGFVILLDARDRAITLRKQFGGTSATPRGEDTVSALAFDAAGQLVVAGANRSKDAAIDGRPIPSPPQHLSDGSATYVVKLSANAEVVWTKGFASQSQADVVALGHLAVTERGDVRGVGNLRGAASLDEATVFAAAPNALQGVLWGWAP